MSKLDVKFVYDKFIQKELDAYFKKYKTSPKAILITRAEARSFIDELNEDYAAKNAKEIQLWLDGKEGLIKTYCNQTYNNIPLVVKQ